MAALLACLSGCAYDSFGPTSVCERGVEVDEGCDIFTALEWARIEQFSIHDRGNPPPSPTNAWADDEAAAALGERLFFDEDYAGSRTDPAKPSAIGCAGCHDPDQLFQEALDGPDAKRNTPTFIDAAYYEWWPWDGRFDSLWAMSLFPVEGPMGSDRLTLARRLHSHYGDEYRAVFCTDRDDPDRHCDFDYDAIDADWALPGEDGWDQLSAPAQRAVDRTFANFGKALEAYVRRLRSPPTPLDAFIDGDPDAISEAAKRGLKLFVGKADCVECHDGWSLSDGEFHVIGLPPNGHEDEGRALGLAKLCGNQFNADSVFSDDPSTDKLAHCHESTPAGPETNGAFRTKHLRGVARTGRYMHSGVFGSLEQVVEYYVDRSGPAGVAGAEIDPSLADLDLRDEEIDDLVAFLETLTFEPVSPHLPSTAPRDPERVTVPGS